MGRVHRVTHALTLVYVAGPFSAPTREGVEANIRRAALRGLDVARLGACPIVPHSNTSLPEYENVQPYAFWIEATLEMLCRCDALLTVDGWEASSGARGEVKAMTALGRPVFHDTKALAEWLAILPTRVSQKELSEKLAAADARVKALESEGGGG